MLSIQGNNLMITNFNKLSKLIQWPISFLIIYLLIGCSSPTYNEANDKIAATLDKTSNLLNPAHVVVTDEAFIDSKPISIEVHPEWTARPVNVDLNGNAIKLKALMDELFKNNGEIRVHYQEGIEDLEIKDLVINGKIIDVLFLVSKYVNYHFVIDGNNLTWTLKKTKIFQLGILPGEVTYSMGGVSNDTTYNGGFGSIVGSGVKGGDVTYRNSAGGSVWDTLQKTLDRLISKNDGSYVINKDASVVTVIDRPNNLDAIADYVKKFNNYHLQQVGIKIQVLEVELNEEHKRGIDWELIRTTLKNSIDLKMQLSRNVSSLATIEPGEDSTFTFKNLTGKYAGSNALIQYLEQQGHLTVLSEPRFTILNNQVAEIKITRDEGYVRERKDTLTSLGTSQVGITPGSIKTGFSLYVVPTIFDSEVLLQITTSISRKVDLVSFNTDSTTNSGIQLPTISDRRFTQRSVIPNNSTLVLTGFKSVSNSTGDLTPFNVNILGGQGASNVTTEIVLLITPVIIRG
jgi:type IVB pilus formation R64 PilN family outer membrane protein